MAVDDRPGLDRVQALLNVRNGENFPDGRERCLIAARIEPVLMRDVPFRAKQWKGLNASCVAVFVRRYRELRRVIS